MIIKSKLSTIQDNINNMIYNIIQKKIIISSDTNNINIHITDSNNIICNYFGGMEYFVVSLCFKIFFNTFLNISSSGLLIIDEGVSVFSHTNIHKFPNIANFIKQYYNNIILITHIDAFKDFITKNIIINKKILNNYHTVSYLIF
jgi:DNA repair exonuclease SbcCD ATPase subunit